MKVLAKMYTFIVRSHELQSLLQMFCPYWKLRSSYYIVVVSFLMLNLLKLLITKYSIWWSPCYVRVFWQVIFLWVCMCAKCAFSFFIVCSLMSFFIGNQEKFQTNSSVHNINTRNKHHLHRPVANLSYFQKGASYSGIRIFNSLPRSITNLKNEKTQFKVAKIKTAEYLVTKHKEDQIVNIVKITINQATKYDSTK